MRIIMDLLRLLNVILYHFGTTTARILKGKKKIAT